MDCSPIEKPDVKPEYKATLEAQELDEKPLIVSNTLPNFIQMRQNELENIVNECFGYHLKVADLQFMRDLYTGLPVLIGTWNRIGFNTDTKKGRLETFYSGVTECFHYLIECEKELERKIRKEIAEHRESIEKLCVDLQITPKSTVSAGNATSALEEETFLSKEVIRLNEEKTNRLESFEKLARKEALLCKELKMSVTQIKKTVPSENELNSLAILIKEMEKEKEKRSRQMSDLKKKITFYATDLEPASFAEKIILETFEKMSLNEDDLAKTSQFLDLLMQKHNEAQKEIEQLRLRIKELWDKFEIDNPTLKGIVIDNNFDKNTPKSNFCCCCSFLLT